MSDADLLDKARRGDRASVEALLRAHFARIRSVLFRLVGGPPDLDDVTQKVLIEVSSSLRAFRGDAALSTWIHTIAVRAAWAHLRARSNVVQLDPAIEEADGAEGPARYEARERLRAAEALLARLPPERRAVFVLHDVEGHSAPEIARLLGIPEGTVHSRLREARAAVRRSARRAEEKSAEGESR